MRSVARSLAVGVAAVLAAGVGAAEQPGFVSVSLRASPGGVPASDWALTIDHAGQATLRAGVGPEVHWTLPKEAVGKLEAELLKSGVWQLPSHLPEHWGEDPGWCWIKVEMGTRSVEHVIEPSMAVRLSPADAHVVRAAAAAWRAARLAVNRTELPDGGCSRVLE